MTFEELLQQHDRWVVRITHHHQVRLEPDDLLAQPKPYTTELAARYEQDRLVEKGFSVQLSHERYILFSEPIHWKPALRKLEETKKPSLEDITD